MKQHIRVPTCMYVHGGYDKCHVEKQNRNCLYMHINLGEFSRRRFRDFFWAEIIPFATLEAEATPFTGDHMRVESTFLQSLRNFLAVVLRLVLNRV